LYKGELKMIFHHEPCGNLIQKILVFKKDLCIRTDYDVTKNGLIERDFESFSGEIERISFKCPKCGWVNITGNETNFINEFLFLGSNLIPNDRFTRKQYGTLIRR
jgi:hypothetical protein